VVTLGVTLVVSVVFVLSCTFTAIVGVVVSSVAALSLVERFLIG
jgi:hypothetical protein